MGLAKWKVARRDFEIVLKKRPGDADATSKYKLVDKTIRRIAFEKAISDGSPGTSHDLAEMTEKVGACVRDRGGRDVQEQPSQVSLILPHAFFSPICRGRSQLRRAALGRRDHG
jgi:hypothetical protein